MLSLFLPFGRRFSESKRLYEDVRVKYLSLAGKAGLVLFWVALLLAWNAPLAKPFASLLGLVAALILLVNFISLLLFWSQPRQGSNLWSEGLQLLLFGAFHWQTSASDSALGNSIVKQVPPADLSEIQTRSGQADQQHTD